MGWQMDVTTTKETVSASLEWKGNCKTMSQGGDEMVKIYSAKASFNGLSASLHLLPFSITDGTVFFSAGLAEH